MELAVGNLDFDGDIQDLVERLMEVEPLSKIFDKVNYLEKLSFPDHVKVKRHGKYFVISPKRLLRANRSYVPKNGRLLILTSYPLTYSDEENIGIGYAENHASVVTNNFPLVKNLVIPIMVHEVGHTLKLKHGSADHWCVMYSHSRSFDLCGVCRKKLQYFIST